MQLNFQQLVVWWHTPNAWVNSLPFASNRCSWPKHYFFMQNMANMALFTTNNWELPHVALNEVFKNNTRSFWTTCAIMYHHVRTIMYHHVPSCTTMYLHVHSCAYCLWTKLRPSNPTSTEDSSDSTLAPKI